MTRLAVAALCLSLPALADAPAAWTELDTPGFTVDMPAAPTMKDGVEQTPAGQVKATTWGLNTKDAYYAVAALDYPAGAIGAATASKVLEAARKGGMANIGGTVDSDAEVKLEAGKKKYLGREFDGSTTSGLKVAARLFVVEDRLYQLITIGPKAAFNAADFKKFADSFKPKAVAVEPAKKSKK